MAIIEKTQAVELFKQVVTASSVKSVVSAHNAVKAAKAQFVSMDDMRSTLEEMAEKSFNAKQIAYLAEIWKERKTKSEDEKKAAKDAKAKETIVTVAKTNIALLIEILNAEGYKVEKVD